MVLRKKHHEEFLRQIDAVATWELSSRCRQNGTVSLLNLPTTLWRHAAKIASELQYRFVALWAQDLQGYFMVHVGLEITGTYLFLTTQLEIAALQLPTFTLFFPAANRLERHTHDMFGIEFIDHPDLRRWTRHAAWGEKQFPLRKNVPVMPLNIATTPPDNNYPFVKVTGSGVYEIPVGPVHAGIIEPGHFRFQVAGEDVMQLEEHLGYVHKGIEKIAEGREVGYLIKLAGRVSGDSSVAYAWSATVACESAADLPVPTRALYLRAILSERERVANHLGDLAAICNDVAYAFAYYQLMRLKELWLRSNAEIFGHRLLFDQIILGGVRKDITVSQIQAMHLEIRALRKELHELYPIFEANAILHDRLKNTGVLSREQAINLGVLGYVARASGCNYDMRHHAPYAPYDKFRVTVPLFNSGDVLARVRVRAQETLIALDLLEQLLNKLPVGDIAMPWVNPNTAVEGIGLIEGWRGEILTFVRIGIGGLVERYFPRDPSWFFWPALEELIHGNIVPDFPVCNKSINGTYSGVDL